MSTFPNFQPFSYDSETDILTGALNKSALVSAVKEMTVNNNAHAFILLDLDGFKKLNSTPGHISGNQLLVDVVASLRRGLRRNDIIGRIGGDEFVALTKNVQKNDVMRKASELLDEVPCSIGIVPWMKGMSVTDIFDWADDNMYEAKRNGKGSVCFNVLQPRKTAEVTEEK